MTPETADALIAAVRGATDELFAALHRIRRENPQDFERVKPRMLKVLSSLGTQLLEPACREHPDRVPKAIGGPLREPQPRKKPGRKPSPLRTRRPRIER